MALILLPFIILAIWAFFQTQVNEEKLKMWEIFVPASNESEKFTYEHHKKWDEYVKSLAGGLTILKPAKGEWIDADGKLFVDKMIPVPIKCTKKDIKKIIQFTIRHYNQEAVLAYKVSNKVKLISKNQYE